MDQLTRIAKTAATIFPNVQVFVEKQDSFVTELWVWLSQSKSSPLESMSGLTINGVSHRAIFDSLENALKLVPFLEQATRKSDFKFSLVHFKKERTVASV